jgi:hypothetical protein
MVRGLVESLSNQHNHAFFEYYSTKTGCFQDINKATRILHFTFISAVPAVCRIGTVENSLAKPVIN